MKSRGLGDDIHKFTTQTGIKKAVDFMSKKLNIPCGCEGRREAMNKLFPNCLLYTSPSPRDRTRSRMPSSA